MSCPAATKKPQTPLGGRTANSRWELRAMLLLLPASASYFSASWWYKYIFLDIHHRREVLLEFAQGGGIGNASASWGEGRYPALRWANVFHAMQSPLWYGIWTTYCLLAIVLILGWRAGLRHRGYVAECFFVLLAAIIFLIAMQVGPWSVT